MVLVRNTPRDFGATLITPDRHMPMDAGDKVFEGSMVSDEGGAGYVHDLVAGEDFLGFSLQEVDNTNGADGAVRTLVRREGWVLMDVAGVTGIGDERAQVYASDDATLTLTPASNSLVGRIEEVVSGIKCWVRFWGAGTKP